MFLDASAIVAIIVREDGWDTLIEKVRQPGARFTSALAIYESVLAVRRILKTELSSADRLVRRFLDDSSTEVVPIGPEQARLAVDAHARFGKGRHPARLNMGDCFAYASARAHGAKLLYKGDDFSLTDIEAA